MATMVLSAIGSAVGGPIGGLIGAITGSVLDRAVLGGGKSRTVGPRLTDLSVQSSTYGEIVPLIYGRVRVAGNVIWSSGLVESSATSGGGKGQGSSTQYSYSVSMAVALSGRPILDVGRIWADGKLIRNAGEGLGVGGVLRLYTGTERQPVDSLIEAVTGVGDTPGYRGLAYIVFEDFPLAEFANRVPNLTFEVIADADDPLSIGVVAADLAQRAGVVLDGSAVLAQASGYVVARDGSVADSLDALGALTPLRLIEAGGDLTARDSESLYVRTLTLADVMALEENSEGLIWQRSQALAAEALPYEISLIFYDRALDYQAGLQRARKLGVGGVGVVERREAPAVIEAAVAKTAAQRLIADRWARRREVEVAVTWAHLDLMPGDVVDFEEALPGRWEILEATVEGDRVRLRLVPTQTQSASPIPQAESGSGLGQVALGQGATLLALVDAPDASGSASTTPRLGVVAGGEGARWRRASLYISRDGGAGYGPLLDITNAAVFGQCDTVFGAGSAASWDEKTALIVTLANPDAMLLSASSDAVLAGANLCRVGAEIAQFRDVEPLESGQFRLTGWLRGRLGTEAAMVGHGSGETFVLLDTLASLGVLPSDVGATLWFKAVGPGEALGDVAAVPLIYTAGNLRPWAPVHLRARRGSEGIVVSWIRRSRLGASWLDGTDAPLGEEAELYDVEVWNGAVLVRSWRVSAASVLYGSGDLSLDGLGAASVLDVSVRQVSASVGPGAIRRALVPVLAEAVA